MAKGGDITEITFNHPTAGSITLLPKSDEDATLDLGGFRIDDDQNMIDGGGQSIVKMNRKRWLFEGTIAYVMGTDDNIQKLIDALETGVEGDWTFTIITGQVYRGTGLPVGDLQGNANAVNFPLTVQGSGRLRAIQ